MLWCAAEQPVGRAAPSGSRPTQVCASPSSSQPFSTSTHWLAWPIFSCYRAVPCRSPGYLKFSRIDRIGTTVANVLQCLVCLPGLNWLHVPVEWQPFEIKEGKRTIVLMPSDHYGLRYALNPPCCRSVYLHRHLPTLPCGFCAPFLPVCSCEIEVLSEAQRKEAAAAAASGPPGGPRVTRSDSSGSGAPSESKMALLPDVNVDKMLAGTC